MSYWYGDEDPFSKVGIVRVVVVRHNNDYGFNGKKDNCTQIMSIEAFEYGFLCLEKKKARYGCGPSRWLEDSVRDDANHKINHLFKNLPNGIYELTGEAWHWSSRSYEGEWDGDTELRDTNIQEISFDHAVALNNELWQDEMQDLLPRPENRDWYYSNETDIHPYMTLQQILCNQANALTKIIHNDNYYGFNRTCYKDSTVEELENCIHMLMLQIDSEKQKMQPKALEIDEKVQSVIKQHKSLMDPEF